jgi:hypothetical protein
VKSTESGSPISVALASFKNGAGYWQSSSTSFVATPEWQDVEATGRMPREGEAGWKEWMTAFWLRIDCHSDTGQVFIDDVRINEAEPLDAWAAWQDAGWDKNGIVADPLFMDVAKDDFRLKPESPAIKKLGFKPLPIDQMGLTERRTNRSRCRALGLFRGTVLFRNYSAGRNRVEDSRGGAEKRRRYPRRGARR